MNWIGYISIYFVTWCICLFLVLPWGVHNQSDEGQAVLGSERGAPVSFRIGLKLLVNTVLAAIVVALIYWGASNPTLRRYWG
jgi:predicted secreted protein